MSGRRGIIKGGDGEGWNSDPHAAEAPGDELPWLEPAEHEEEPRETYISRPMLIAGVLIFIGLLAAGVWMLYDRFAAVPADEMVSAADVPLFKAPEGPLRVPADPAAQPRLDGEGEASFEVAAGVAAPGQIDLSALPEAPVARPGAVAASPEAADAAVAAAPTTGPTAAKPLPATTAAAAPKPAQPPAGSTRNAAAPPAPATLPAPAAEGGAAVIQLGAFSSEAKANAAWTQFAGRYGYLAGLTKQVRPLARDGGTLYRLHATGIASRAEADRLCARLKVAGESCLVAD